LSREAISGRRMHQPDFFFPRIRTQAQFGTGYSALPHCQSYIQVVLTTIPTRLLSICFAKHCQSGCGNPALRLL
jgi:hypothetical protein